MSDIVAENEDDSLEDIQVIAKTKALDYQMSDRQAELRVGKLGDTSQRQIRCTDKQFG